MGTGLKVFLIAFALFGGMLLIWRIMKRGGGKAFIFSAFQGIAAMSAVNLLGGITGIGIAVNTLSIATSVICGLPGVAGLLFAEFLFLR